ncbi:MAG TPA: DinB family protein [Lapillicoccus sp.]|nr:DinB family protein [Lapillicoccus sp.]
MAALPPLFAEEHACEPCGLAYAELSVDRCLALVTDSVATLEALLPTVDDRGLRRRPEPGTWSVVEYACHVRDVLWVFAVRLHRGVHEDRPALDPMYNDWRGERFGYARVRVDVLLAELRAATEGFVEEVRSVPDDAWNRVVVRRPEEVRTVRWLVRQAAHECVHHLGDVRRILGSS